MRETRLLENDSRAWIAAAAAVLTLLPGCTAPDPVDSETQGEGEEVGEVRQNALTNNALTNNALTNNALSNAALAGGALSSGALSTTALSNDGIGLQLLKYMIRCAIPSGVCLNVPTAATDPDVPAECSGGSCQFCGNLGLVPGWQNNALSVTEERWVSACLLAHVNLNGVSVPISARDSEAGYLAPAKAPETNNFSAPEAAFYGNVFRKGPNGDYEKYVCNAGASTVPPGRMCGLDPMGALKCSMKFTGSCAGSPLAPGANPTFFPAPGAIGNACTYLDAAPNGAVGQCQGKPNKTWKEVITIYDQQVCGNGVCSGSETKGNCPLDCVDLVAQAELDVEPEMVE